MLVLSWWGRRSARQEFYHACYAWMLGQLTAARAEFVAFDLDGGLAWRAMEYPTGDLQLHAAGVVQHGWPVHRQPHFLAALESVLGGEPHFATADFERFAGAFGFFKMRGK